MEKALKKEHKYHLVRKQNQSPSFKFGVRFASIIISFLLIILLFSAFGKFSFGQTVGYMFSGTFGNNTSVKQLLLNMCLLGILALGLTPTYRMKFWNTGALGQALIGNLCSALVVFYLGGKMPNVPLLILAFAAAIVGGAIWGVIPGIFKAKINANETLFTLMMNYIAIQIVEIFIHVMKQGANFLEAFKYGHLDPIGSIQYGWVYIITGIIAIFMFIYLKYTKHGYEITVLGESFRTAKYAGIDTNKVIIRTAAFSGALCAICGFIFTTTNNTLSISSDGGYGFTSIVVTWTSHFSITAVLVISFLVAFLKKGSEGVKDKASDYMNEYASYIAIGIFLFFLIGCEFFLFYKITPNSIIAKQRQEKRERFIEKHPKFYSCCSVVRYRIGQFFAFVDKLVNKCKFAVSSFFEMLHDEINHFFRFIRDKIKNIKVKKGENK